jgi:hypothetical protein
VSVNPNRNKKPAAPKMLKAKDLNNMEVTSPEEGMNRKDR